MNPVVEAGEGQVRDAWVDDVSVELGAVVGVFEQGVPLVVEEGEGEDTA